MRQTSQVYLLSIAAGLLLATASLSSQTATPQPLTVPLAGVQDSRPLLEGVPQTTGMRSGFVHLKPGETVGHANKPFIAPAFVYIPPATRHNVANTGTGPLEYVYVVAPAKLQ